MLRLNPAWLRLYLIADIVGSEVPGDFMECVQAAVSGGVTMVQLRAKQLSGRLFVEIAAALQTVLSLSGTPFIINDRLDIAMAVNAHGVHLGKDDLPPTLARQILGEHAIIGHTIRTPTDFERAKAAIQAEVIDYFGTGAVYPSSTKTIGTQIIGLNGLQQMRDLLPIPMVAIGGITANKATEVMATGVNGIAVSQAIMGNADPHQAAHAFFP